MQENIKRQLSIRRGLAIFGAAILFILPAARAAAQSAARGPLPAAKPSDQPAPQVAAQPPAAKPNLAGTWALNKDQSDDPRQKMREAMGGGGYGGRGGWGGGGNGGGWGAGGGRRGGGGEGRGEDMMKELSQLTIVQTDATTRVTGSSGRVLALYSASSASNQGRASPASSANSDENTPPAGDWEGSQFVVVNERRRGTSTQTYELSPNGKHLFLTTKVDSPRFSQPVTFRLVYDPVKSSTRSSSQ